MQLVLLDWFIVVGYLLLTLAIGLWATRRAGRNTSEFFLSGRGMPWWLLGTSMVATVTLAAIKIGSVLLGVSPLLMVALAGGVTVVFSMSGGLRGVLLTDFLLFALAMTGSIAAAVVALGHPAVGGVEGLLANPALEGRWLRSWFSRRSILWPRRSPRLRRGCWGTTWPIRPC